MTGDEVDGTVWPEMRRTEPISFWSAPVHVAHACVLLFPIDLSVAAVSLSES